MMKNSCGVVILIFLFVILIFSFVTLSPSLVILIPQSREKNPFHCALRVNSAKDLRNWLRISSAKDLPRDKSMTKLILRFAQDDSVRG